jgi:hypothetical protein
MTDFAITIIIKSGRFVNINMKKMVYPENRAIFLNNILIPKYITYRPQLLSISQNFPVNSRLFHPVREAAIIMFLF